MVFERSDEKSYVVAKEPFISYLRLPTSPAIDAQSPKVEKSPLPFIQIDTPLGPKPMYPREAIRLEVTKGQVHAILEFTGEGDVRDVVIQWSDPCGLFDRVVKEALFKWKLPSEKREPNGYKASIETNFMLKDEYRAP